MSVALDLGPLGGSLPSGRLAASRSRLGWSFDALSWAAAYPPRNDLAVIDVKPEGLVLREIAPGWSKEELQKLTGVPLLSVGRAPEIKFN